MFIPKNCLSIVYKHQGIKTSIVLDKIVTYTVKGESLWISLNNGKTIDVPQENTQEVIEILETYFPEVCEDTKSDEDKPATEDSAHFYELNNGNIVKFKLTDIQQIFQVRDPISDQLKDEFVLVVYQPGFGELRSVISQEKRDYLVELLSVNQLKKE